MVFTSDMVQMFTQNAHYAIAELMDTERTYVEKLKDGIANYLKPVLEGKISTEIWGKDIKEVARLIFVNMEDILQFHEEVFLPTLERAENSVDKIVECFLCHKDAFSLYTAYILGRSKAEQWISRSKGFFESRRKDLGDKREFATYVIAPVQRFTKYKLLLKDIAKYTRYVMEDADRAEDALYLMTALPKEANNIIHISMIRGLQHDLLGHGQLRHLGQVIFWDVVTVKKPCDVQIFLFDLRLIITDPQDESGFYQHKADCLLTHSVRVVEDNDSDRLHWTVVYQDKETEEEKYFHFLASSVMNKGQWIKHLKDILQSHEELARGLGISKPRPPATFANGDSPVLRQLSNFSNSSLDDLSSSDLDDDRPTALEYRQLPEKLRKSNATKQKNSRAMSVAYPRRQLSIFPGTMLDLETDPSQSSRSPQLFRKALHRGDSTTQGELKKKGSLTPRLLMRSIIRASTKPKRQVRYPRDVKEVQREKSFCGFKTHATGMVKSPTVLTSSQSLFINSSDEEDELKSSYSSHQIVSSSHLTTCTTRIFIGKDDIDDSVEKTHILMAQPGEVYMVGDRASGSDFWYVKVLNSLTVGGKKEGWIKSKQLQPFHAPFIKCDFHDLYRVKKEISKGRFSTVKTCLSRQDPALLAAKFMPKTETALLKFAFELNVGLSLKHPNLVRFKEGIEDKNQYIIVMERVPGLPLLPYILKSDELYESTVATYATQLCKGLAYMHKRGLMHLDVRPENILVHSERLKLCDFGATRYKDMEPILEAAQTSLEPEQVSSVLYASPEVYLQEKKTPKTDMWGVGVVTYVMLFGGAPFMDKKAVQIIAQIMEARPSLDAQLISNEGQEFLDRLITKQQRDRLSADQALQSMWLTTRNGYISARLDLSRLSAFVKSSTNIK